MSKQQKAPYYWHMPRTCMYHTQFSLLDVLILFFTAQSSLMCSYDPYPQYRPNCTDRLWWITCMHKWLQVCGNCNMQRLTLHNNSLPKSAYMIHAYILLPSPCRYEHIFSKYGTLRACQVFPFPFWNTAYMQAFALGQYHVYIVCCLEWAISSLVPRPSHPSICRLQY